MFETTPVAQLERLAGELRGVLAEVAPAAVPFADATALWDRFDEVARLGDAGRVLLASRVEEAEQWRREGHRSAAEHLAHRGGVSIGAARGLLGTSKRLTGCPQVESALRRGELSDQQAEAIADAVEADANAESRLVDLASQTSVAELRVECARVKAAADPDPEKRYRRIHRQRRVRQGTNAEGAWWFSGQGTVDAGAEFNTVLEPIIDQLFDQARERGERVSRETLAFDALIELARRMWTTDDDAFDGIDDEDVEGADDENHPTTDVDATELDETSSAQADTHASEADPAEADETRPEAAGRPAHKTKKRRRRSRNNPRYLALLRADLTALMRGQVEGDETCEIAGFGPVSVAAARELLGDAVLRLVLTRGNDLVNTTYLGRGPNAAQKIALLWTSPTCVVTGCVARRVQHDHRRPWAHQQETRLDNIDDYCAHHHQLKTLHNWALVTNGNRREMVPPTDPRHPDNTQARPVAA